MNRVEYFPNNNILNYKSKLFGYNIVKSKNGKDKVVLSAYLADRTTRLYSSTKRAIRSAWRSTT